MQYYLHVTVQWVSVRGWRRGCTYVHHARTSLIKTPRNTHRKSYREKLKVCISKSPRTHSVLQKGHYHPHLFVDVIGNKVSTYEAGIHTLEMAPEHQSIKARLFNRVQNAYLWIVTVVMVMYVQLGKHSLLMCPASWTPYVHLHKTAVCVRSIWHPMHGHICRSIQCMCVHVWTHCTHRECSTSTYAGGKLCGHIA